MEKVAEVTFPGSTTTGADASADRIAVRTYGAVYEWDVRSGDTLAAVLARPPTTFALPPAPQGEAIAYTVDGLGLWVTSETPGGPVHLLTRAAVPAAPGNPAPPAEPAPPAGPGAPFPALVVVAAGAVMVVGVALKLRAGRARHRGRSG
jgi:hypothetical protein